MKKKLLISFLGSIALVIGLCCFSSSALSEEDTKVLNYWFSQNGLSRIDSSVTAPYSNFLCLRESDGYYLYLTNYPFYFYSEVSNPDNLQDETSQYPSVLYLYMKEPVYCYKYKDINDTWNFYTSYRNYIARSRNWWSWLRSNPYLSSMNIDIITSAGGDIYNTDTWVIVPNFVQDNFIPLKDWYIANTPLENPFEDNNGLFFSTIKSTMDSAYNSLISPLFVEFQSIGIVPFLFFFLVISIVFIWFMQGVFYD